MIMRIKVRFYFGHVRNYSWLHKLRNTQGEIYGKYPVRCIHNPAPCHFFEPSGETCEAFRPPNKQWFWKPGDQFWGSGSHFGVLHTYFQHFWDGCVFLSKSALADPPPRHTVTCFLQSYGLIVFLELCMWWIFVIFSAQRFHSGAHFRAFLEALGLLKNSWKCVTIVISRGLTLFGRRIFPGLDRECVWRLSFNRNLRF